MNGVDGKNESFQLLQLSDDSKSLSDLELPEIINQRKRKVRRKTRPRTTSIRHGDDDRSGSHIDCKNFGLWLAILMTILWLFIISYITSVVHNENRRLEIAIQKVSATSQNVPEALQKWHETSKNLEQNQTALNGKLRDIQQAMGNFSTELKQLRDTIEKKNENSQETQLNTLQSNVAKLGSSLNDAITRIQVLEEHRVKSESEQKTLTKSVEDLQTLFAQIRNASSLATSLDGSAAAAANNVTEQNIANIQRELTAQIENLSKNFTGELESLRQKSTWLRTDLVKNKASIDELIENSANISSHVKSVENIWVEMKANLSTLEGGSKAIGDQLEGLQNVTNAMKVSIGSVRDECERYHGQSDTINGELGVLKLRLEKVEQKEVVPPATAATVNVTEQPPPKDPIPNKLNQLFNNNSQPTPSAVDAQKQPASATTSTATPSLPAAGNTSPTATSSNASAAAAAAVASGM
ncbi:C-type lectin domain family 4 member F isoform X3 [Culex pipiens pallens]|uniref:C-type lectin domain family 4 member F isoform X3 n=1 Tax=Culex pipiens pallens TaxID=42434 RepID=UPI0019538750|nr:C-type lectin domain family 4 member F isoform X3 [Culex pipiens pallens]